MNTQHHRRSIRLPEYDYAQCGAYFVTICTWGREPLFGEIRDGTMQPTSYGLSAAACWQAIPAHFPQARLDAFIVMPNHVHGIIMIDEPDPLAGAHVGAQHAAPLHTSPPPTPPQPHVKSGSLGAIVRSYKSAVTREVNLLRQTPGAPAWQRSYYDHIIRHERALNAIREYIWLNPARWAADRENPTLPTPIANHHPG